MGLKYWRARFLPSNETSFIGLSPNRKHLNPLSHRYLSLEVFIMSERAGRGLEYECVKCGAKVKTEELELRGGGVKCTYCGYRVLKKKRPPVVKRISTG
jgi:DNA-directed RNA polymerase subunit RPC12/RpoP